MMREERGLLSVEEIAVVKGNEVFEKAGRISMKEIMEQEDVQVRKVLYKEMLVRKKGKTSNKVDRSGEVEKSREEGVKRYLKYQKDLLELADETEAGSVELKTTSNIDRLEYEREDWLKNAKPTEIPKSISKKIVGRGGKMSFIFSAEDAISTKFVAESMVYSLVKHGNIAPHEIKRTTLKDAYENIHGMFEARKWKQNFFNYDAKVMVIENSSDLLSSIVPKGQDQFWKELLSFIEGRDIILVITYSRAKDEEIGRYKPNIAGLSGLTDRVLETSHLVDITKSEEEELKGKIKFH